MFLVFFFPDLFIRTENTINMVHTFNWCKKKNPGQTPLIYRVLEVNRANLKCLDEPQVSTFDKQIGEMQLGSCEMYLSHS